MNQEHLNEMLTKHKNWIVREKNGERADLRDAYLRDANLSDALLRGANLRGANLRDAILRDANLRDANLRDADLRDADLRDADLRDADLRDADLARAKFDTPLMRLDIGQWSISLVGDQLQIGCQRHSIAEWQSFDNEQIHSMHTDELDWWLMHKEAILGLARVIAARPWPERAEDPKAEAEA